MPPGNPCVSCGACCTTFRVSFYWAEAEVHGIPDELVIPITPVYACMAGTSQPEPRCVALEGEVGRSVRCTLYERRPGPCRELEPGDEKCLRARARHGVDSLTLVPNVSPPGNVLAPGVPPDDEGLRVA
ncbi:MAG: YkgJ family cysteine cluster protein [Betaproteobacteria bacterium]|nr:YkgJ family cysteine cluster protein [Betaproteobacteria bacterium]